MKIFRAALTAGLLAFLSGRAPAHTLPISYLFIVADKDYVHLELSFNPFEVASFTALDTNHNARLDPSELVVGEARITRDLIGHLQLFVNDKAVPAETAGITPDIDTHHATLRAHYRADARHATLAVKSGLQQITSSSHLTQVNLLRGGKRELAQLDAQISQASFSTPDDREAHSAASPARCTKCSLVSGRGAMLALSATLGFLGLRSLQHLRRPKKPSTEKDPRSDPLSPSNLIP